MKPLQKLYRALDVSLMALVIWLALLLVLGTPVAVVLGWVQIVKFIVSKL